MDLKNSCTAQYLRDKWWLRFNNVNVGYWLEDLFMNATTTNSAFWNVHVRASESKKNHTRTQLGSGNFLEEGWRRASFFKEYKRFFMVERLEMEKRWFGWRMFLIQTSHLLMRLKMVIIHCSSWLMVVL